MVALVFALIPFPTSNGIIENKAAKHNDTHNAVVPPAMLMLNRTLARGQNQKIYWIDQQYS
ncbi:hypothetical protein GALMADRAFT_253391 [Galerina marginata CBS 339.88]|uniref:Uncharacterized protein n=1 Tax=Galerina marginata (strain CBS 339.88) TaxID=685588 RepID=A0A067SNS5_GALM3|nr:hypothetical protein GALMADRAFT_260400 [Galerina marginata CBS 339.88]KDR71692.1 hypothetical protein GALMADRAFT_253391 [Galerina marginata CBS 339.88]